MSSYRDGFNTVTQRHRERGASVIRVLALILLAFEVVHALVFAFYEGRKGYWDHRVQQMCEEDGGTRIFERVDLSREEAKTAGIWVRNALLIPPHSEPVPNPSY